MRHKTQECPNCHRKVSLRLCMNYLLHGTSYRIRCNHCNAELSLLREPIPFKWCPLIGFLSTVVPAEFMLFYLNLSLLKSLIYSALIGSIVIMLMSIYTIRKIKFRVS